MANVTTTGLVTIHRLKSGVTVQLYLSTNKALYQIVDTNSKTVAPAWNGGNGPVITPILTGGTMSNVKWYLNMPSGTASSNRSQYDITTVKSGKVSVNSSTGALTFSNNIITADDQIQNQTLTFVCNVTAGGAATEIQRTIVIDVRSGGENSYWGHIEASNGTTLGKLYNEASSLVESTKLIPSLSLGKDNLDASRYTVQWRKTGAGENGADLILEGVTRDRDGLEIGADKSLTVYRNGVDGAAHFEAHFFVNNQEVEAEGIQITDNADTYFIAISGDMNVYSDNANNTATLVASVYETQTNKLVSTIKKWAVTATDTERMREYIRDTHYTLSTPGTGDSGAKATFAMKVGQMYVPNTNNGAFVDNNNKWLKCGDSAASDTAVSGTGQATECEVIVQFTATI